MAMIKNSGPGEVLEREWEWDKQNNEKKNNDLNKKEQESTAVSLANL